jgi:uncharacterized protein (DUF2164 family)
MPTELFSADPGEPGRIELTPYSAVIPLGSIAMGVDNIHYDVYLSPKFVQASREYLFELIRQTVSHTYLAGIEVRPAKSIDNSGYRKLLNEMLHGALTQAKHHKNIEIDHLFRVALVKFLTQELGNQFGNLLLEGKAWIRQRGEYFERSQSAHVLKARLSELQAARRNVLRGPGQQIQQMLIDLEENVISKARKALFGEDYAPVYELLKNRIVFLDGGKDEIFFLENYVLLGSYARDPDRFEEMDALFQEFVREAGIELSLESEQGEAGKNYGALLEQVHTVRKDIAALEEQREGLLRKQEGGGGGLLSRFMGGAEPSDVRASLHDVEMRLNHQQVRLEELGPQMDEARQKMDFYQKQNAGRLGDYLNEPENARRMFDVWSAEGEEAGKRGKLLGRLIDRLEEREMLLHVLASYEVRPVRHEYCPPVHLQQLRKALVSKEELKRVEEVLKQVPARQLSLKPLEELARRIRKYSRSEKEPLVLKFATDFLRLRRDLRDAEHLAACMERVSLVTTEQMRDLSRMNNRLYECVLQGEARAAEERVISHVIIKTDVRGSTGMTQDLLARGLNPASHFSMNLHEPVKKLLDRYDAKKVFIEGDAIILAIFETDVNQAYARVVAKACVLARQIRAVSNTYNDKASAGELPRLEIGSGIAFQGDAPAYWTDGDSKIMISKALNLSDRLSGCAKLARRLLAGQRTHFSVFQFLSVVEGASAEEADEFLVRYNMNGIELNEDGFQKLSEEISMDRIETALEMPWGRDQVTLCYGEVPLGDSVELIVLRKGYARELLPDGRMGKATEHSYYEVCTAPALHQLVAALARAQAAQSGATRQ